MLAQGDSFPKNLKGLIVKPDNTSKLVSLDSLSEKRPVVLFFYPKDMTPGCTIEAQKFRDYHKEISEMGAAILGCSKDSEQSHGKFIDKHELPYPLISDPEGEILNAFGVWGQKKMYGKTFLGIQRSTFILKDGKVIQAFPKVNVKKHAEEVISFLKSIS